MATPARNVSARTLVVVLLGLIFLLLGKRHLLHRAKIGPATPFHSSDQYLNAAMGGRDGTERILRALPAGADHRSIAVVYPQSEAVLGFLVLYLSWPRPVLNIRLPTANTPYPFETLRSPEVAAVFFCNMEPPSRFPPGVPLGKNLIMVLPDAGPTNSRP